MIVKAKQPLFRRGVKAYKGEIVEVDSKAGKSLISDGLAEEVKTSKSKKADQ